MVLGGSSIELAGRGVHAEGAGSASCRTVLRPLNASMPSLGPAAVWGPSDARDLAATSSAGSFGTSSHRLRGAQAGSASRVRGRSPGGRSSSGGTPSAGRDSLARDTALLESRLADLEKQMASALEERDELMQRLQMQALARQEVLGFNSMLQATLAAVSAEVRDVNQTTSALRSAGRRRRRASQEADEAQERMGSAGEPGELGSAPHAAQSSPSPSAEETAAKRAQLHAVIGALGPAVGALVAAWEGVETQAAEGGAEGLNGAAPQQPERALHPAAQQVREARTALLEVDDLLRQVSQIERSAAAEALGRAGEEEDEIMGLVAISPEGRVVPARELVLQVPVGDGQAGAASQARGAGRGRGRGGGIGGRGAAGRGRGVALSPPRSPPSAAPGLEQLDLTEMLAALQECGEEAMMLEAHLEMMGARRSALETRITFSRLDRDRDGVLKGDELAGAEAFGVHKFILQRFAQGALGFGPTPPDGSAAAGPAGVDPQVQEAAVRRSRLLDAMGVPAQGGGAASPDEAQPSAHPGEDARDAYGGAAVGEEDWGHLMAWVHGPPGDHDNLALWFRLLDMDGDLVLTGSDILRAVDACAAACARSSEDLAAGQEARRAAAEDLLRRLLDARNAMLAASMQARGAGRAGGRGGRLNLPLSDMYRSQELCRLIAEDAVHLISTIADGAALHLIGGIGSTVSRGVGSEDQDGGANAKPPGQGEPRSEDRVAS